MKTEPFYIAWWSAGITSAVATKIALDTYKNVRIVYIEIDSAHADNERFIKDCEEWYGQKIERVRNEKGYLDQFDVIQKTKFINGPHGARCTLELKKQARFEYQDAAGSWLGQIFGFEFCKEEINRAIRFAEQWPDTKPLFPLIDAKLNKAECHGLLKMDGIEPPAMYQLGYPNNNCIGCVKGRMRYWNKIRVDFPDVFDRMAKLEREVGRACIKQDKEGGGSYPVFLDELESNRGILNPVVPNCGMFCQVEFTHLMDKRVADIESGAASILDALNKNTDK